MTHLSAMLARLPSLYREGELVAGVLGQPAQQVEIVDEETLLVQRAHWFDAALELGDATALAAVLDIGLEPWQTLGDYRAWVHALRDALLEHGAVTPAGIRSFVDDYTRGFQQASGIAAVHGSTDWGDEPESDRRALVENPRRRRFARILGTRDAEPLEQFRLDNKGLRPAPLALLARGLPDGAECSPLVANLTTGEALWYQGAIEPGARLAIRPSADGGATALLEGDDVSDRLLSIASLQPGFAPQSSAVGPPRALTLARGANDLWFLPLAAFDRPALDRALLALADLALHQGRFDEAQLDHALFYQEPAAQLYASWVEVDPATFDVVLPGGALTSRAGETEESLRERDTLVEALELGVSRLRAAGVRSSVRLAAHASVQPAFDTLTTVLPVTVREHGSTGADALPDHGGLFGVTDFDESIYR